LARRKRKQRTRKPASPAAPRDTASEPESNTLDEAEAKAAEANEAGIPEVAPSDDLDAVHAEALERYEAGWEKDRQNQSDAYDDLKFLADDEGQWDPRAWQQRKDEQRPILTVNKCPQFVRQITGDIRQMRPAIHVVPVDERANANVGADVMPEMVRYIERRSDAKGAYFHGADQMVSAGIGHCRVFTEYAADTTFNQEIGVELIVDGIAVVWDPDAVQLTRKDAMFCFVPIDLSRKPAEAKWPGKSVDAPLTQVGAAFSGWSTDEHVRICEYWRKVPMERELAFYADGRIIDLTDDTYAGEQEGQEEEAETEAGYTAEPDEDKQDDKPTHEEADYRPGEGDRRCENCTMFRSPSHCTAIQDPVRADMLCDYFELKPEAMTLAGMAGLDEGMPQRPLLGPGMGPKRADAIAAGARIEKRDSYKVERYVISGQEILEGPDEWPGMHIPIVPFLGEEVMIGRRCVRRGVIRVLKDVQRLYNYAVSADAEAVALQPKAPFKGTRKNFENFLDQWETANTRNWPFLEYDPDPENGGRPPEREPPPVASTGIKELLGVATADMSAVTGIYPPQLGQASNETSGKAIVARQREGDTGTFHYIEAFARAIERVGQIVVDLIPHIYDTERTLRVVGDDGKPTKVEINKPIIDPNGDGIDTITLNDMTIGAYQVSVEMGPSYSTKREEAREGMQVLMQSLGQQVAPLFADLYVEGQDFPLSKRISDRLKFLLPPQIAQAEAARAGEPPPPAKPPQPNPEAQVKAAELQLKQREIEGKTAMLAQENMLNQKKLQVELVKIDAELQKARIAQETAVATAQADVQQTALQHGHERGMSMMEQGHELGMAAVNGNGAATLDEAQQQQIDALTNAVQEIQQAMMVMAKMLGGGQQMAPTLSPSPPAPSGPPPGPPAPPMAPFIGEPQPPPEGAPPGVPPPI
jgi:Phage P22-like portal protein